LEEEGEEGMGRKSGGMLRIVDKFVLSTRRFELKGVVMDV
jgi:hypothetical protein